MTSCPLCLVLWNNVQPKKRKDTCLEGIAHDHPNAMFLDDAIYQCPGCKAGIVYPYYTDEQLMKYYSAWGEHAGCFYGNYQPYYSEVLTHILYANDPKSQKSVAGILLASAFRQFKSGDYYLEIGAGHGKGIRAAQLLLPPMNYFAVEPDRIACQALRCLNVNVSEEGFSEKTMRMLDDRKFHLITICGTLDHLTADKAVWVLRSAAGLLAKDGILHCTVMNYTDMETSRKKPNPNHLTLFTSSGLHSAVEHNGMKVIFMQSNGKQLTDLQHTQNDQVAQQSRKFGVKDLLRKICPAYVKNCLHRPRQIFCNKKALNTKFTTEQLLSSINSYEFFQYGPGRENLNCLAVVK